MPEKTHKPYIGSSYRVWKYNGSEDVYTRLTPVDSRYWMNIPSVASVTANKRWKFMTTALNRALEVSFTFDFDFNREIYIHKHDDGQYYYLIYIIRKAPTDEWRMVKRLAEHALYHLHSDDLSQPLYINYQAIEKDLTQILEYIRSMPVPDNPSVAALLPRFQDFAHRMRGNIRDNDYKLLIDLLKALG